MRILRLLAVSATVVIAGNMSPAKDVENTKSAFIVKAIMTHTTDEVAKSPIVVEADAKTEIPIRRTILLDDGGTLRFSGTIRFFVPSPELMSQRDDQPGPETTEVGPKMTCRVRRTDGGRLLLDVELTETELDEHSIVDGTLVCTTRQLRSVRSVRHGEAATFSWPADESGTVSRQITMTVEE